LRNGGNKDLKHIPETNTGIKVEYSELGQLLFSHRDSIVYRIRQIAKDALARLAIGDYHSTLFFNQISGEIEKSRELFRGFTGKESGKDICEFLEESFTQKELKIIFDKMEASFLLSEDATEKKYLTLTGYIEIVADEIFSKLIRELREIEQG
jgi:hypothetical protein